MGAGVVQLPPPGGEPEGTKRFAGRCDEGISTWDLVVLLVVVSRLPCLCSACP